MLFNSLDFGIFFPLVFFLYWFVFQRNIKARNIFLIAASYTFYAWWDWRFLSLIIISSAVDFVVGQQLHAEQVQRKRKALLLISLFVNLGFLGFFKYYNFFVDSFVEAFRIFGAEINGSSLNIILPVGISFYTFQTLSYTLDIYYRKMEPTRDIFSFFAFVAFFPQLVAGPIERARNLLPQFHEKRSVKYNDLRSGLLLMAWGFFKKIVLADRLAIFVDTSFADVENVGGLPAIIAVIFFTFQLYLDFSAYSDIAIGSARTMGFRLSLNFNRPYLSSSFSDFWRRWHISLSSWFKDYVYIPLGGNRAGEWKMVLNTMIVFLLSGLWHGASWNFVIWGAINGAFILIFDRLLNIEKLNRFVTSIFVTLSWAASLIFFRAESFGDAITMYKNLFIASTGKLSEYGLATSEIKFTLWLLLFFVIFEVILEKRKDLMQWFTSRHYIIRWSVYILLAGAVIFLGSYGGLEDNSFIYFQF